MSIQDADELQKIEAFKKGYLPFIEAQNTHAKAAQQLLTSAVFTTDEKRILSEVLPEIDKQLSGVQTNARQVLMELNSNNLQKEAGRDFHAFFKGDLLEHQMAYIVFFKTYVLLTRFSKSLADSWKRVRDLVTSSKLSDNSEFRRQMLHFRVGPVMQDIESLRLLTSRMAMILQVQRDPLTTRDPQSVATYRDDVQYQLSSVFQENLSASAGVAKAMDWEAIGITTSQTRNAAPAQAPPVAAASETYRLNGGGSQSWNMTPYYYFTYDPRLLEVERTKFNNIIHIDTHMGADQNVMRSERILKYTRKMVQQDVHVNLEQEYTDFLTAFFNLVLEITCLNMGMPPKLRQLFLFHLGPQSFYYLTRRFLQELDTGTIHRRSGKGTVMEKFVPGELVKKVLLDWWHQSVLRAVGPERDDISQYRAIIKVVKDTYDRLSAKAMQEYDQMPEASRQSKNRAEIIRENLNKWLGPTNIIVFRRFLKSGT